LYDDGQLDSYPTNTSSFSLRLSKEIYRADNVSEKNLRALSGSPTMAGGIEELDAVLSLVMVVYSSCPLYKARPVPDKRKNSKANGYGTQPKENRHTSHRPAASI
jgi:hypothetical protein